MEAGARNRRSLDMLRVQKPAYALIAIAVVLAGYGCGGGSSSTPTGATTIDVPKGATITGTVVSDLTMSSSRSPASIQSVSGMPSDGGCCIQGTVSGMPNEGGCCVNGATVCYGATARTQGLKVTVVGTSLATVTDNNGKFTISGLPEGTSITLRFEGEGVDATLTVNGVPEGQTLTVVVEVAGQTCKLWKEGETSFELKFVGRLESITPPTLVVSGKTVIVTDGTQIQSESGQPLPLTDLRVGDLIKVFGTVGTDGVLTARVLVPRDDKGC
jgi:hypothetical protein